MENVSQPHSILKSIALHLSPGLVALTIFTLIARPVENMGFPSIMPWLLSIFPVILLELGYLFYEGKRRNGHLSLDGVIAYRQPLKTGEFILWTVMTFITVLILYILSGPLTNYIQTHFFSWVPEWFILDTGLENSGFSKSSLLIVNIASIFVFVIGVPIVEELYFRGYLLPRLSQLGRWSIIVNSILFSLYHFTTPWMLILRFLITLPMAYTAHRKQSIIPGIVVHVIANSVDVVMGFLYVLNM
jgi:uncharacterized protein